MRSGESSIGDFGDASPGGVRGMIIISSSSESEEVENNTRRRLLLTHIFDVDGSSVLHESFLSGVCVNFYPGFCIKN